MKPVRVDQLFGSLSNPDSSRLSLWLVFLSVVECYVVSRASLSDVTVKILMLQSANTQLFVFSDTSMLDAL